MHFAEAVGASTVQVLQVACKQENDINCNGTGRHNGAGQSAQVGAGAKSQPRTG